MTGIQRHGNAAEGVAFAGDNDVALRAAQAEYSKLEKTLTETEIAGWV